MQSTTSRLGRATLRHAARPLSRPALLTRRILQQAPILATSPAASPIRCFSSSRTAFAILPDAENPPPRNAESIDKPTVPTDIPTSEFHERADAYLNTLVERLEEAQEKDPAIEVEYSAGVLEIRFKGNSYVLNKQPPNKQIWLSSPVSGPKRYDWVVTQEGLNHKQGGGIGDWIYLRDGSSLTELVRKELGVDVSVDDGVPN